MPLPTGYFPLGYYPTGYNGTGSAGVTTPMTNLDSALISAVCTSLGRAHLTYKEALGDQRQPGTPSYWIEMAKNRVRGGLDVLAGILSGCAVSAQTSANNTVKIAAGSVQINGQTVAVSAITSTGTFPQTDPRGTSLIVGTFYDVWLAIDAAQTIHQYALPWDDRDDATSRPQLPQGYVPLAKVRVRYQSGGTSIINAADIFNETVIAAFAAPTSDLPIRNLYSSLDLLQQQFLARTPVKTDLLAGIAAIDNYVKQASVADGLNGGTGYTLSQWAKATSFSLSDEFRALYRDARGQGKDMSLPLAALTFTASGVATFADNKKSLEQPDNYDALTFNTTGAATSTITITMQQAGQAVAQLYTATVPPSTPAGTSIRFVKGATTALVGRVKGSSKVATMAADPLLQSLPPGIVSSPSYTSLAAASVTGGTSGDIIFIRSAGA